MGWPLVSQARRPGTQPHAVPSGNRIRIDYAPGPPVLAVKVQECFGLTATPTVGGGRTPLVLHLLSPAGRPTAVTSDLASFWRKGYPQVRAELRGRYPKHPWPEDPLTRHANGTDQTPQRLRHNRGHRSGERAAAAVEDEAVVGREGLEERFAIARAPHPHRQRLAGHDR